MCRMVEHWRATVVDAESVDEAIIKLDELGLTSLTLLSTSRVGAFFGINPIAPYLNASSISLISSVEEITTVGISILRRGF